MGVIHEIYNHLTGDISPFNPDSYELSIINAFCSRFADDWRQAVFLDNITPFEANNMIGNFAFHCARKGILIECVYLTLSRLDSYGIRQYDMIPGRLFDRLDEVRDRVMSSLKGESLDNAKNVLVNRAFLDTWVFDEGNINIHTFAKHVEENRKHSFRFCPMVPELYSTFRDNYTKITEEYDEKSRQGRYEPGVTVYLPYR